MGDTVVNGADTPRHNPRTPYLRNVSESIPVTDTEADPTGTDPLVCIRTFTRSSGCPTRTAQAPPIPPEMKDWNAEVDDFGVVSSSMASIILGGCCGEDG